MKEMLILGIDLQELSNLRIWLTFSGDFPGDLVNPFAVSVIDSDKN